jgi:YggT family protein
VISTVISFIHILATVLVIAIIIRALMSWIMPQNGSGLTRVLLDITEPILAPIRRVLPPVAGIDFSPILAMILVQLVSQLVTQLLASTA